jgi:murein L,D-transpeptidase YcbB/YkuD
MRRVAILMAGIAALACAGPLYAQDAAPVADVAPAPLAAPAPVALPAPVANTDVQTFYAAHPGTLVWLRDADTRAAAARLVEILKRAPIDGLVQGPALAASVEAALASGTPADDATVSIAWVRYVDALKAPVAEVGYGDPALALKRPAASAILSTALAAPSLVVHLDQVASVNPLYAALRGDAIAQGREDDPHVRASLDRLRLVPATGRAVLVDVANQQMMMLEDGVAVDTMKVIVGKEKAQTPLLAGTIHYVTFNPYWHIPQDVAKRVVAPLVLKRGVAYLKAAKYQAVAAFGGDKEEPIDPTTIDWKAVAAGTVEANIRQLSGPNNMMGKMKFGFVNDQGIFLHDTPHKNLFAKAKRNLSLGCVRLEHPERLAQWLLGREPTPPGDGSEQNVLIDTPDHRGVPVYITYLTARPDGDQLAFAPDVYGLDAPDAAPDKMLATASAPTSASR